MLTICLLSHTFTDMEAKIRLLVTQADLVGREVNVNKTKCMRV